MQDFIEDTDTGIYRITMYGEVLSQSKIKIPLVTKGMEFTGEFKHVIAPERKLTYRVNNRGYYSVSVRKKTHMVHRLIAQAFIPNPENKPFINHKDGNKLNNHVDNLEWCTAAENNTHARESGLHVQAVGHKINYKSADTKAKSLANLKRHAKISPDQVRYIRDNYIPRHKEFGTRALGRKFNVSSTAITKIIQRVNYPDVV